MDVTREHGPVATLRRRLTQLWGHSLLFGQQSGHGLTIGVALDRLHCVSTHFACLLGKIPDKGGEITVLVVFEDNTINLRIGKNVF